VWSPFAALGPLLYRGTGGLLQSPSLYRFCQQIKELPPGVTPPHPVDTNSILDCRSSFFDLDSGHTVGAAHIVVNEFETSTTFEGEYTIYMLDPNNKQTNGYDITPIILLLIVIYLIILQNRFGATLGMRVFRINTIGKNDDDAIGVPLKGAVIRTLAPWLGFLPLIACVFAVTSVGFTHLLWLNLIACGVFAFLWGMWILVAMVRKRDPPYDLMAGTAVVRRE
jgi:uncharacterized RDD family membrane protein YckC